MKKIAAVVLLSAIAGSAYAGNGGVYAGVTLGSGQPSYTSNVATSKKSDTIFGGQVGYKFTRNLAVEAGFTGVGKVTFVDGTSIKGDAFYVAAVGTLPVSSSFDLYGKLGVASTKTTVANVAGVVAGATQTGLTYGLGGQYNVSNNVAVRFGWDRYQAAVLNTGLKVTANTNVYTVGAVFSF